MCQDRVFTAATFLILSFGYLRREPYITTHNRPISTLENVHSVLWTTQKVKKKQMHTTVAVYRPTSAAEIEDIQTM